MLVLPRKKRHCEDHVLLVLPRKKRHCEDNVDLHNRIDIMTTMLV
jgi:hypothetical protein